MFKLSRDKYIAALESAEELEKTLRKENENLGVVSQNLAEACAGEYLDLTHVRELLIEGNNDMEVYCEG